MRVVADYDVDRAQVYRRRRQSRALLIARELVFVTDCPCSPGRVRLKGVSRVSFLCYVFCIHVLCVIVILMDVMLYQVVIAAVSHLFPFRTEKLSPPAPMVLQCNAGE